MKEETGQELLHVKENKARNLVLINIKYVEYFEFVKEWVSICAPGGEWVMILKAFSWRRKRGCIWEEYVEAQIIEQYWRYGSKSGNQCICKLLFRKERTVILHLLPLCIIRRPPQSVNALDNSVLCHYTPTWTDEQMKTSTKV